MGTSKGTSDTAKWQTLSTHVDQTVVVLDASDKVDSLNRPLLGRAPREWLGKSIHALAGESALRGALDRLRQTGAPQSVELVVPGGSGQAAQRLDVQVHPLHGAEGIAAMLLITDRPEPRPIELDPREIGELWHSLIANTDDTVVIIDKREVIRFINRTLPPTTPQDVLGTSIYQYVMPEHHELMRQTLHKVHETGEAQSYETKMNMEAFGGHLPTLWFVTKVVPVKSEGTPVGAILIATDITAAKRAEMQLRDSQERWRSLVDNTDDTIQIVDRDGIIRFINRVIPPKTEEDIIGTSIYRYVDAGDVETIRETLERVFSTGTVGRWETRLDMSAINPALPVLYFSVKAVPTSADGETSGAILIASDISNQKYYENELRQAKERAEAANQAKSAFLANMSHEIRTPMNAILGFSQLLLRDAALSPHQRQNLDIINRSGEHLLGLINDILEMSKIEAGRVVFTPAPFDLRDLLEDLETMFRMRAEARGLTFATEVDAEVPRRIVTDQGKLRQALINLLGNAVKFTERGGILLKVRAERGAWPTLRLFADVEDTGVGIAREDQARLFQAFQQTASGVKSGGTGLGLALSLQFARLMNGNLTVTSEPGVGSTFHLEIRAEESADLEAEAARKGQVVVGLAPGQARPRVLVVDDTDENRLLLSQLLRGVGFDVYEARDGAEAIDQYEIRLPDLVLMDMRLPVLDGYEATRRIKITSRGQQTPVIAVTASAFENDRQAVLDAGADAYLRKPFKEHELFSAIESCLKVRFVYREGDDEPDPNAETERLTFESLAELPEDLVEELRLAARRLDVDRTLALVEAIPSGVLAEQIRQWVNRFEFEALLALLDDKR